MGNNTTRNRAIIVIVILAAAYSVGIFKPLGVPSPFGIDILSGDINIDTGQMAPQKFTLAKRGTSTAVETATVYAHYDWNGNGMVDLGAYPEGEIEELASAATTGLVTTTVEYPIGKPVFYQIHKTGYEVETFSRVRSSLPSAHDGSALVVPSVYLTLTNTYTSLVRVLGVGYLATTTPVYDWDTDSPLDEPTFEFEATSVTTDAGVNEQPFTHWGTGDVYAGTVMAITMTNQDFIDLGISGWDGFFVGASNTVAWWNTAGFFDDADLSGDEVFSLQFDLKITADGDIAAIGLYNGMELKNLLVGVLNSPIATHETVIKCDDGV